MILVIVEIQYNVAVGVFYSPTLFPLRISGNSAVKVGNSPISEVSLEKTYFTQETGQAVHINLPVSS